MSDTFEIPVNIIREAAIESAKRTLFNNGITPTEYKEYYAREYSIAERAGAGKFN